MERASEYLGILVTFVLCLVIAGAMLFLNKVLGPKNKLTAAKAEPFECGVDKSPTPGHFNVKFYLIAMLFILFDVEIVWLFPWAVVLRDLKWLALVEMISFLAVLGLGYVYVWKKGALEWER